jgi:enterochelin esterase-like enzyme
MTLTNDAMNDTTSNLRLTSYQTIRERMRFAHDLRRGRSRDKTGERRNGIRRFRPSLDANMPLEARRLPSSAMVSLAHRAPEVARTTTPSAHATIVQERDATIILPPGLQPGRSYPLVVAFSYNGQPVGDQYTPLTVWRTLGPELGWIVYASKAYRNQAFQGDPAVTVDVARSVKADLEAAFARLPVDRSRIVLAGMSGAGNFAEYFNLTYPGFAAAVIDNSGRIPFERFGSPTAKDRAVEPMPDAQAFGASRRLAVFLASPSDTSFYIDATRHDRPFYQSLGWQTLFLSFSGGHRYAPIPVYLQAIHWLESRPSWQ